MSNPTFIKTLVFFDLESSGVPTFLNPKYVRCTEISLVAIDRNHFDNASTNFRILNRISLCINPRSLIDLIATELSGLDNYNLETQQPFTASTAELLIKFLDHLEQPVCLLAHNGIRFDFPLLKAELNKVRAELPENVRCLDTYLAMMDMLPPSNIQGPNSQLTPPHTPVSYPVYPTGLPRSETLSQDKVCTSSYGKSLNVNEITPPQTPTKYPRYAPPSRHSSNERAPVSKRKNKLPACLVCPSRLSEKKSVSSPERYPYPIYSPKFTPARTTIPISDATNARRVLFPSDERSPEKNSHNSDIENIEGPLTNFTISGSIAEQADSQSHIKLKDSLRCSRGYSLKDLYKRMMGKPLSEAHEAEVDAVSLMEICNKVKNFSNWMDQNSTLFAEVKGMW